MPTIDNTGQSAGALSTSSLSISSFAVGSGPNRCIYLSVSQYSNPDRVPSAKFNGTENFVVHDQTTIAESPGTRRVTILRLVNPSNVMAAIAVTWPGAVDEAVIGADSWTGVDQTTPFGTAVKTSSSTATSSSVSVSNAIGDVVHDALAADGASAAQVVANQTQRWRSIAGVATTEGAGQSADGTGSSITLSWTSIGNGVGARTSVQIGVAIQQAGGATSTPAPLLPTMAIAPFKGRIGPLAMVMRALRPPGQLGNVVVINSGVGSSIAPSFAYAFGSAIVTGTGVSRGDTSQTTGAGSSVAQGTGNSRSDTFSSGAGSSVAQGVGNARTDTFVSGAGASISQGVGNSRTDSFAIGAGSSVAAGVGNARADTFAFGSPSSVVTATGNGSSIGTFMAFGQGSSVARGDGSSFGHSSAVGAGSSVARGDGSSFGYSSARGVGSSVALGNGSSFSTSFPTGSSSSFSIVSGVGNSRSDSRASAQGSSVVQGIGQVLTVSRGSGAGSSVAQGVGSSFNHSSAVGAGGSLALGIGSAFTITWVYGEPKSGLVIQLVDTSITLIPDLRELNLIPDAIQAQSLSLVPDFYKLTLLPDSRENGLNPDE